MPLPPGGDHCRTTYRSFQPSSDRVNGLPDTTDRLHALEYMIDAATEKLRVTADRANEDGRLWGELGRALLITRQAPRERSTRPRLQRHRRSSDPPEYGQPVEIAYDGIRRNLDHLGRIEQERVRATAEAYIEAGMRPPSLSVVVAGRDVTKQPELWPATERDYLGPGRLQIVE